MPSWDESPALEITEAEAATEASGVCSDLGCRPRRRRLCGLCDSPGAVGPATRRDRLESRRDGSGLWEWPGCRSHDEPRREVECRSRPRAGRRGGAVRRLSATERGSRGARCLVRRRSTDWTAGNGIAFRIKPAAPLRLSVSFFDRNRVVYTTWIDLRGGEWQPVLVSFASMLPNPYFQPPDARTGAPIDVSEVKGLAFAPQSPSAGQFAVSKFVVVEDGA